MDVDTVSIIPETLSIAIKMLNAKLETRSESFDAILQLLYDIACLGSSVVTIKNRSPFSALSLVPEEPERDP